MIPRRLWRILGFTSIALIISIILVTILEDEAETYDPLAYLEASLPWSQLEHNKIQTQPELVEDKIIVIPAMPGDDTTWVENELPDWQRAIYHVKPSFIEQQESVLTTPANKGHEAMTYLTYIIDHYKQSIPAVVVFLHSHRWGFFKAWHVDTPLHDNVFAVQNLQLGYVLENGYVNLRCNWNPGCNQKPETNKHISIETWNEIFNGTSTPVFNFQSGQPAAGNLTSEIGSESPGQQGLVIETPCCAQFAVTRERIYARPLDDYIKMRRWLMDTEQTDAKSGRVFEFLWHIIFGMEAVHCPDPKVCYCKVYGRC